MKVKNFLWKRKGLFLNIISILLFIFIIDTWGFGTGALVYLAFFLIIFIYRMYRQRELFMMQLRSIETKFFTKPLDKGYWRKGELKKKRIKLVWRKPPCPRTPTPPEVKE